MEMQSGSDSRAKGTHGVPAHTHAPAGAHGLAENHDKGQDGRSSNGRLCSEGSITRNTRTASHRLPVCLLLQVKLTEQLCEMTKHHPFPTFPHQAHAPRLAVPSCTQGGRPRTAREALPAVRLYLRDSPCCTAGLGWPRSPGEGWCAGGGPAKSSLSLRSSSFSICQRSPTCSQRPAAPHLPHNTDPGQGAPSGGRPGLCPRELTRESAMPPSLTQAKC